MVVAQVNRLLRGWANYFTYGTRLMAYRAVDQYVSTVPASVTESGLPPSYAPPGGGDRREELDHEGRFTG